MLTNEIINQIYMHETHPKYSRPVRILFYVIGFALFNFSIYLVIHAQDFMPAAAQMLVVIAIFGEARSKRGFSTQYIQDLVDKLTTINLMISDIKDNRVRVEITKEFNYYIDLIIDRPNAVSQFELNKLLNDIKLQIAEEEEAERQGYHFTTEEEFEEQRRAEEEAFQRRKAEYRRQQQEEKEEKRRKQQEERQKTAQRKINYFDKCFTMDDLNKRRKELLRQYHPDNHKNILEKEQCEQIAKEINEAYTEAKDKILNDFTY